MTTRMAGHYESLYADADKLRVNFLKVKEEIKELKKRIEELKKELARGED